MNIDEVTLYPNMFKPGHVDNYLKIMTRKFNVGKSTYQLMMSSNGVEIWLKDQQLIAVANDTAIGYCNFMNVPSNAENLISVTIIYLDPKYRSQNLGFQFYEVLLLKMKKILVSQDTLYKGGQVIWARLIKDPRFVVIGSTSDQSSVNLYTDPDKFLYFDTPRTDLDMATSRDQNDVRGRKGPAMIYGAAADNIPDWLNDKLTSSS